MAAAVRLLARDYFFEVRAKQFLKETHSPESLEGVVQTKPPKGAIPILISDITLLREKRKDGLAAPCPICCPRAPKYLHGALAWFGDEGVYRCIGMECIATLCGVDAAYKVRRDFDFAKTLEADYEFAFENIDKAPATRDFLNALLPAAEHIERLRRELGRSQVRGLLLKLAKQHDGRLIGWDTRKIQQLDPKTNLQKTRTVRVPILYGNLSGLAALNGNLRLVNSLKVQIGRTSIYCIADAQERILDAHHDHHSLSAFRNAVYEAQRTKRKALDEMQGVLSFFDVDNFDRINRYGSDRRNPENIFASAKDGLFRIGPTISDAVSLRPEFKLLDNLPKWPWDA